MIFGSLPGIVMIYLLVKGEAAKTGGILLIVLLTGVLYLLSVARFGNRFEQKRERVAEALS
jgi:hypothetical protein